MVDLSGNFTIYEQSSSDDENGMFTKLYDFKSADPFTPSGFTANRKNGCFYVGNRFKRCVYRIILKIEDEEVDRQGFITSMKADNEYPKSMSSLPDGRLAVLVAIEQPFSGICYGRIDIYKENGELQMTINPPNHVVYPWCVVCTEIDKESGNDTYALSYGSNESGVIRLDNECRILAECKKGPSVIRGIKYDETNGSLYIADLSKCRLLQMDLKLEVTSVIHDWLGAAGTANEIIQPVRLNLNTAGTHMIVGFESGRVSFYRFERPSAEIE